MRATTGHGAAATRPLSPTATRPTERPSSLSSSHWDGLCSFLDDGRVELDSNTVERSIRPLTLNRKNALFAGSDDGGDNWAVIASLIENAKLNRVDPQAWLADTQMRLANGHRINALGDIMPWTYAARVVG